MINLQAWGENLSFQFLIGRLATFFLILYTPSVNEFQFLIGRLATPETLLKADYATLFQFLIGRLATREGKEN